MRMAKARKVLQMIGLYRNWIFALRNRVGGAGRRGREAVYRLRSGATFSMEPGRNDVRAINEVWLDRVYELEPAFAVRNGWTVVDLGAHRGTFTVRAALAGPQTEVHAVEPSPENLERLRRNITLNHLTNAHVYKGAVAAAHGQAVLHVNTAESGCTSLVIDPGHDKDVLVSTILLDDLLENIGRPIDLVKMDIEGAERQVLSSTSAKSLRSIRRLVLEYHATPEQDADAVAAELRSLLGQHGFVCRVVPDRTLLFAESQGVANENR